jgi:D-alanyl-D-alanine carboxypeptidase
MDLVTLLMACTVSVGTHGASPCSAHAPVSRYIIAVAEADPGTARTLAAATLQAFIVEASNRFGVPASWIRAVMAAESGCQTILDGRPITSSAGAMGLMQVMPETYAEMRLRYGLGADPYDPHDNILAGVAYLRAMYERYGYPGLFAAYNAGPARFDDYLLRGVSLPDETLHYLLSIAPDLRDAVVAQRPDATARLLAGGPRTITPPSGDPLFFPLGTASIPTLRASITVTGAHVFSPDFGPGSPLSGGLFVPLTSASGAAGDRP